MAEKKYLDKDGLEEYTSKIKERNPSTWKGTRQDWDLLSTDDKKKWQVAIFTDDTDIPGITAGAGIDIEGGVISQTKDQMIFKGTLAQWNNLGVEQKKSYGYFARTDSEDMIEFHYSTDEQFTGKYWIDGKKIYCRVFHLEINEEMTQSSKSAYLIENDTSHVYNVLSVNGHLNYTANGNSRVMIIGSQNMRQDDGTLYTECHYDFSGNVGSHYILIKSYATITVNDAYVILEYTKTTD